MNNIDILEKFNKPPKFNPGDVILSIAGNKLIIYQNGHGYNKYTVFDPKTKKLTYEGRNFLEQFPKVGTVDIEIIKVLYG